MREEKPRKTSWSKSITKPHFFEGNNVSGGRRLRETFNDYGFYANWRFDEIDPENARNMVVIGVMIDG